MALRSASIPNLLNGVSQQPEILRDPTQGGEQLNWLSSVVEGLTKRPPVDYIGNLSDAGADYSDAFVHFINRDAGERYTVAIQPDGTIQVYDLVNQNSETVATPDGVGYVTSTTPRDDLRAITVADHTFIVNRAKIPAMLATLSTVGNRGTIINVVQGAYNTHYTVQSNTATIFSHTTLPSTDAGAEDSIRTNEIAAALEVGVGDTVNWTATSRGSSIHVTRQSFPGNVEIHVTDSIGGNGMIVVHGMEKSDETPDVWEFGRTQVFSDLPNYGRSGIITGIIGDPGTEFDDYWLQSVGPSTIGNIRWEEVVKPLTKFALDPSTMPHLLVRESDGSFTFKEAVWSDREAGDEVTNPDPAFIGAAIEDVFFFGNRLGFLTGEHAMLSETGEFFNFFRVTATTILDTDPINVSATTNEVALLRYAVPYQDRMIIFADNLNFELKGSPLTPNTVSLNVLTEYPIDPNVRPVAAGQSIFFAFDRDDFVGVREFIGNVEDGDEARDITEHVPHYIPGTPHGLTHANTENLLFVTSDEINTQLGVYKYFWQFDQQGGGRKKVQSSWSRWQFDERLVAIQAIDHFLYITTIRQSSTGLLTISRIDLRSGTTENSDMDFTIQLDLKIADDHPDISIVFDDPNTTVTLPYQWNDLGDQRAAAVRVFSDDEINAPGGELLVPLSADGDTGEMVFAGDITADTLAFGLTYTARYRFTSPTVRESRQGNELGAPITEGRLTLLFWAVNLVNSGFLRAIVTLPNGNETRYDFNGEILTDPQSVGALKTGILKFPIRSDARDPNLSIEVLVFDSPFPVHMINAGWEGSFAIRSKRF